MKAIQLKDRVNRISEKLVDSVKPLPKLSFNSFSESEKTLIYKVDEIEKKYRQTGSIEILDENTDLINKEKEIILTRVEELYCSAVLNILGCGENDEFTKHFLYLNFYHFKRNLLECFKNLREWSEKEREEFLVKLKK
jgi:hypothetical protein